MRPNGDAGGESLSRFWIAPISSREKGCPRRMTVISEGSAIAPKVTHADTSLYHQSPHGVRPSRPIRSKHRNEKTLEKPGFRWLPMNGYR